MIRIGSENTRSAAGPRHRFEVGLREWCTSFMNVQFTSEEVFDTVDCTVVGLENSAAEILFSRWTSKYISSFNSTNKMGVHWGFSDDAKCPCYNAPVGSSAHHTFFTQHNRATTWRHDVHDLVSCLNSVKIDPQLIGASMTYLISRGTHDFSSCTTDPSIQYLA